MLDGSAAGGHIGGDWQIPAPLATPLLPHASRSTPMRLSLILPFALIAFSAALPAAERPNIVIIMSDDMGYSDLSCYGGEIQTPSLDRLAAGGLRFTQFYNTARCCPTRATLLTGLYSHQAGVGHMTADKGHDGYRGDLNRRCVTIAEVLRPAGYRCYAVGKWHVTKHTGPGGPKDNWPLQRGFDRYYGTIVGGGNYFQPNALTRDNTQIDSANDPQYRPQQFYYTDALSDHAAKFIAEHGRDHAEKPFFLYLAYTAAHWPMHAKEEDIAKYKGNYDAGYGPVRQARLGRMKELGLVDSAWQLSPTAGDWAKVDNKAWEARCMEVYAAMVDCMDQGIGRVVKSLSDSGQLDNTLILFLQDNGGCAEAIMRNNERQRGILPGGKETFVGYGQNWANVSNTPFREYKHWVHEGGISTPLIAHWPKGLEPALRGKLVGDPAHLIDLMPTCVDLAGAEYPSQRDGQGILPMEGASLRPALLGRPLARARPIFWEHEGNKAIREGSFKLVAKHKGAWELYDLAADRTEMHNLAAKMPEKVKELSGKWEAWAARAGVQPWPVNPPAARGKAASAAPKAKPESK
jgi:arylsulfatase